jgi:mutator protein MutT
MVENESKKYASIIFYNSNGEVLLHLRDEKAPINPNKWGLLGGHIDEGETAEETIIREMKEEIEVDLENLKKIEVFYLDDYNIEMHLFVAPLSIEVDEINLHEGKEIKFFDVNKALVELDLSQFARRHLKTYLAYLELLNSYDK